MDSVYKIVIIIFFLLSGITTKAQLLSNKGLQRAKVYTSIEIASSNVDSVYVLELTALENWQLLSKFKNLNILRIQDHRLAEEEIDFSYFPYLQELTIKAKYQYANTSLPPIRLYQLPESITKLQHLKKLDLSNNALGLGKGLEYLTLLPKLESLCLANNEIGVEFFIEETIAERVEELQDNDITISDSLYKTIRKEIIEEYLYNGNWEGEDLLPLLISKLTNLKDLDVRSNYLRDIPESIKQLTQLKRLNLADNHLFQLPVGLCALVNLERLYAERNYLYALPEDIGNLKMLRKITLYQNPLQSLPESFGALQEIKELQFDQNDQMNWAAVFLVLQKLDQLVKLEIRDCGIEKMPEELVKLSHLKEINLYNNPLILFPENIDQLTQLQSLIICDANLYKLPDGLAKLQHLRNLVLYTCNKLNWYAAFELLGSAVSLAKMRLDISYNTIHKLPESIQKLSKLKALHIYDALKTRKHYNLLQKWLPARLVEDDLQKFRQNK